MKADLTGDGETSRGVPQFRTEKVKIFFLGGEKVKIE